jgi:hypothetical protein
VPPRGPRGRSNASLTWAWRGVCEHHICAGTGLTAATSAPGLRSPLPHLRRDCAHRCHICAGTGLWVALAALRIDLLHDDWPKAQVCPCVHVSLRGRVIRPPARPARPPCDASRVLRRMLSAACAAPPCTASPFRWQAFIASRGFEPTHEGAREYRPHRRRPPVWKLPPWWQTNFRAHAGTCGTGRGGSARCTCSPRSPRSSNTRRQASAPSSPVPLPPSLLPPPCAFPSPSPRAHPCPSRPPPAPYGSARTHAAARAHLGGLLATRRCSAAHRRSACAARRRA